MTRPSCEDCAPVILDQRTGQRLPPDAPDMRIVSAIWELTSEEERAAMHRVTCEGARDAKDCAIVRGLWQRMGEALGRASEAPPS